MSCLRCGKSRRLFGRRNRAVALCHSFFSLVWNRAAAGGTARWALFGKVRNMKMRKMFTLLLAAALAVTMLLPASAFAGTTTAPTPTLDEGTSLKWSYDFQSGTMDFSRAPTVPALINDAIYVGSANKVYRFNKDTGKIEATSPELPGRMGYGTTPVTSDEEGNIYVFVTGSQVVKLTPDLKQILWTSDKKYGGQNISPVKYIDGRVYSGTWGDDYESAIEEII